MDITELIEEYLALRDQRAQVDIEELVSRAGDRGPELREQIAVFSRLEELADTIEVRDWEEDGLPERIGRFRILRSLGRGGLSRVFLAEDERLGRRVALKVLHASALLGSDPTDLQAVTREGRSLAKLRHPAVVEVHEIDAVDGHAYVAMEYIEGPSLFEVLEAMRDVAGRGSPDGLPPGAYAAARALQPVAERCRIVASIARALHMCHENGVVHRDIKPGNILLDPAGEPKLVDFGLAHLDSGEGSLGHTEALVGTAPYVAPEQVDQERTGALPASDQFSLGVVLYELLTLENPFARDTRAATMTAISRAEPPGVRRIDPDIHPDVELVCAHCLERDPGQRYPDLAALARDLEDFVAHRPISLRAPSLLKRARLWARRSRGTILRSAAAVVGVLLVGSILSILLLARERATIVREVETIQERAAACVHPGELADLYLRTAEERRRSLAANERFWSLLFTPLPVERAELFDPCSRRLADILGTELGPASDVLSRARIIERHRGALDLDRRLCPECPYNRTDRDRGYVEIVEPPGARATVQRIRDDSSLVPVEVAPGRALALRAGVYRLTVLPSSGVALERDFEVEPSAPLLRVEARPLDPGVAATMVPVRGADGRTALRISSKLVTWEDVGRVMPETLDVIFRTVDWIDPEEEEPGNPAILQWHQALEYASIVGARMPLLPERELAEEQGIGLGPLPQEWVATPAVEMSRCFPADEKKGYMRRSFVRGTGLRLAAPPEE